MYEQSLRGSSRTSADFSVPLPEVDRVPQEDLRARHERIGGFVAAPSLPEYAARYARHLALTREDGVLEARLHTDGQAAIFSRGMLNAWGHALGDIARDPENEVLVLTGSGGHWIGGFDRESFAQPMSEWAADEIYDQRSPHRSSAGRGALGA